MAEARAIVGRDNWLFLDGDANQVITQITGKFVLPADFEEKWEGLGVHRQAEFAKRGIRYAYMIAPNKECVYSEFLPDDLALSPLRPVFKVIGSIGYVVNTVYPIEILKNFRKYRDTYVKGDTHWNQYGSLLAYQSLMTQLGIKPLTEADMAFSNLVIDGDLSSKIGQKTDYLTVAVLNDRTKMVHSNGVKNIGGLSIWENQDQSLPKLVLFRDSFATSCLKMITQHFSRVVVVWQPNIDYGLVDREQPHYVVSQQAERFITTPPDDINGLTHEQYAARKR